MLDLTSQDFQVFWYFLYHNLSIITGVRSSVPKVQPRPRRTTFQKNEEALDTARTDQNQHDSKCSKTHFVS